MILATCAKLSLSTEGIAALKLNKLCEIFCGGDTDSTRVLAYRLAVERQRHSVTLCNIFQLHTESLSNL